jgi:glycosyltransferase involved in cell wall biosynthesis
MTMPSDATPSYQLSFVCYPFHPTKSSGRGVDRYCWELLENYRVKPNGVVLDVVQQDTSVGTWASGKKLVSLTADLLRAKSKVFHAVSPPAGAAAILSGKRNVVVTIHDLLPFQVKSYSPSFKLAYARWCTDICVAKAAALIVPFRVTRDELVAVHGADPDKIHIVNYGVDHATYYPRPELPRKPGRVLYVGEMSRAKGVDVLLNAFAQVKRRVPHAELWLGGKGKDKQLLEDMARSLDLADVSFKGFIPEDELPALYASATVMVFPSRYGFGLSSLEAMACGTPAIVTRTLDAVEFMEGAGIMVEPESSDDLAANIERALTDPAHHAELSRKGIDRASRYAWQNTASQTLEVCAKIAALPP